MCVYNRPEKGWISMADGSISERDRLMAEKCEQCKVCDRARKTQRGFAFWFVRNIEDRFCPFCQAYERVHGRKAHEPLP